MQAAYKTVSLAIAEKLNTVQRLQVCKPEEIDMLVTELDPSDPILRAYHEKGILIL